jgi:hypothetical protein
MTDKTLTDKTLKEQWALDLSIRIKKLRHQQLIACAKHKSTPGAHGPAREHTAQAVTDFLANAEEAIKPRRAWFHGRSPLDHWRGLSVVRAYENVHAAEIFLVDLYDKEQLGNLVPSVVKRAEAVLDQEDPLREHLDSLRKEPLDVDACRPRITQTMRAAFQAEDQIYLRLRTFRNLVVKSTVLLVAAVAVMVWLVATHPRSMPLCFVPNQSMICPSGAGQPSPDDIMIVAGLGLLGSAAAAAFSIRTIQGIPTPYEVPAALAFFKLPLGAFTAVTGLLLLGAGFVPGFSELDSQRQILAYALAFGYAQQLVSRLIDERARAIVGRLPIAQPALTKPAD